MLELLSGKEHRVITGICLRYEGGLLCDFAETTVHFMPLSSAEIEEYAASGEPLDKAGAYAIQGLASRFVDCIHGCYFNVMGLPVSLVYRHLQRITGKS
jgi:septum formation protein